MTQRRRQRVRAADLMPEPKGAGFSLILLAIALVMVIGFSLALSEKTAGIFEAIVGDPGTELPEKLGYDLGVEHGNDASRQILLDALDAAR